MPWSHQNSSIHYEKMQHILQYFKLPLQKSKGVSFDLNIRVNFIQKGGEKDSRHVS